MRFKVVEGPVQRAQRVLVYGPEGIGKSTLASQMPEPLFIDVEDGSGHLYVRRFPTPATWDLLINECMAVAEQPEDVRTLVIDTLDAAERLCHAHICAKHKKPSVESWGYGKGYVIAAEEFEKLFDVLDMCIGKGVNVMVVAHATMRKVERPDESGAYDRFEVKLNKHIASKAKEWSDAVLFVDYETFVSVDDSGKGHASGGKRVIRTSHSVSWDAKNRWGLPDKLMLDEGGIAKVREHLPVADGDESADKPSGHPNKGLLQDMAAKAKPTSPARKKMAEQEEERKAAKPKPSAPKRLQPLFDKCRESGISPDEVKAVMVEKGKRKDGQSIKDWEAPFVQWLVKQWPRVTELVIDWRKEHNTDSNTDVYDEDIPF